MRLWLIEEEQKNIEKTYYSGGNNRYEHVHCVFYKGGYEKIYDLCGDVGDISYMKYDDYKKNYEASYSSWTYSQIVEYLPSVIYCDNEYNVVDPTVHKSCRKLQLHIIKQNDTNKDINYKYCVTYMPVNTPNVRKRIIMKKYDYKDPVVESDEVMICLYRIFLWCMSKGHVMTKERKEYLDKLEKEKKKQSKDTGAD